MILIENTQIMGWESAIRGIRNHPMNSWGKNDSGWCSKRPDDMCKTCESRGNDCVDGYLIGANDDDLMLRLAEAGSVDGKFRQMIVVYVDITAPLYWWEEFNTYCGGIAPAPPCAKIHSKEFTLEDFSRDNLTEQSLDVLLHTIQYLNIHRMAYLTTTTEPQANGTVLSAEACAKLKKDIWRQIIQLLPSSYNQKRTVMLDYEILSDIYRHQQNCKLDEWQKIWQWIRSLPHSDIITCNPEEARFTCPELYKKFIATHPFVEVSNYRSYPFCDNGIIVWVSKLSDMPFTVHKEIAFRYDPEKDIFTTIPDAKSYDEILNGKKRTDP